MADGDVVLAVLQVSTIGHSGCGARSRTRPPEDPARVSWRDRNGGNRRAVNRRETGESRDPMGEDCDRGQDLGGYGVVDGQDAAGLGLVSGEREALLKRGWPTTPASSPWSRWTRRITRHPPSARYSCGAIVPRRNSPSTSRRSPCSRNIPRGRARYTRISASSWATRRRISTCATSPPLSSMRSGQRFLDALWPLHEASKLGAILFQFPQWFVIGRARKEYLLECKARCDPIRVCVEFRNHTWMSEQNRDETLDFLRKYGLAYVSVDMPQGHPSSIPPVACRDGTACRGPIPWPLEQMDKQGYSRAVRLPVLSGRTAGVGPRAARAGRGGRRHPCRDEQLLPGLRPGQRQAARGPSGPTGLAAGASARLAHGLARGPCRRHCSRRPTTS